MKIAVDNSRMDRKWKTKISLGRILLPCKDNPTYYRNGRRISET